MRPGGRSIRAVDALADIIGDSFGIARLREQVEHIRKMVTSSRRLPPILLMGETGTGKGLLARTLHRTGPRAQAPFVDVNCAAIPEHLLEAELFGFERGAFTGAHQAKPGLFQTAHRGTLFLDELALLPEPLQAKLLKVLEDGSVRRLGGTRAEPVDVWILAATNEDISEARKSGRFRDDLYHRLAVISLALPPLRERGSDILLLAERFLTRACTDYGLAPKTMAPDARAALLPYRWPGNVRELSNVIERAVLLAGGPVLSAADLALPAAAPPSSAAETLARPALSSRDQLRAHLLEVLTETGWNISRTATLLGVARNTVTARMRRFGLDHPNDRTHSGPPADTLPVHAPRPPGIARIPPPTEVPARWERRFVAFLRADFGFSPSGGSVPAMSRGLTVLAEKVETFGGRVEEESPTAIIASFGLGAVEDAPSRAALAALAVQKAGERARGVESAAPTVRIALHVGSVMVGQVGEVTQIDLEGKQAALTALEALVRVADAGEIVVSGPAMPFVERRFELTPVGVSGGPYRLMRREPTGFGVGGRPPTRFVGRAGEVQIAADRVTQAERRQGQVLALVGEPGVGKSRFVYEVTRWERMREWRILGCGGVSYGTATPFLPIADLLRRYFQIEDADAPSRVAHRVRETIVARHPELESDVAALTSLLDGPVDDPRWAALDPPQRRRRTLDAVRGLLVTESRIQPLLLVVEDLHWIDPQTQAVLDTLVDSLPTARILLLVSYRPEYRHQWGSKTYYSQTRIDALTPADARELLHWLVGDDTSLDSLKELMIARTDGNPFFLEESVRALVETGALVGAPGAFRAGSVATVEVPATVQAGLAARIDRLPPAEKNLLQTAAVIGKDVPFVLLKRIVGRPEEALRHELTQLQAAEFLYETRQLPDLEYTFKHALTQEVAYRSLATSVRQQYHHQIARVLAAEFPEIAETQPELLAQHYTDAGLPEPAIPCWQKAGERAIQRSANAEAISHLAKGRRLLMSLPDSPERTKQELALLLALGAALTVTKGWATSEAEDVYNRARELCRLDDDSAQVFPLLLALHRFHALRGELQLAHEVGEQLLRLARRVDDRTLLLPAHVAHGYNCFFRGDLIVAREYLQEGMAFYEPEQHSFWLSRWGEDPGIVGLGFGALTLWSLGFPDKALAWSGDELALARGTTHAFSLAFSLWVAARLHQVRREVQPVLEQIEALLALSAERGFLAWIGHGMILRGWARCMRGQDYLAEMQQGLAAERNAGAELHRTHYLALLAEAYGALGRHDEGLVTVDDALTVLDKTAEGYSEAELHRLRGVLLLQHPLPDEPQAEACFHRALAIARRRHAKSLELRAAMSLSRLWQKQGKRETAKPLLTEVYGWFTEGFDTADLKEAKALLEGLQNERT
jgi:DNA-binding NtrC family response regulator/predicted ATPase